MMSSYRSFHIFLIVIVVCLLWFSCPIECAKKDKDKDTPKKKEKSEKSSNTNTKRTNEQTNPPSPPPSSTADAVKAKKDSVKINHSASTAKSSSSSSSSSSSASSASASASAARAAFDVERLERIARKQRLSAVREEKREKRLRERLRKAREINKQLTKKRRQISDQRANYLLEKTKLSESTMKKKLEFSNAENKKKAVERLKGLQALSMKSNNRIVSLDTEGVKYYANEGPRPYYLFVAFTALLPSYSCPHCHSAQEALEETSLAFAEQRKSLQIISVGNMSAFDDYDPQSTVADGQLPVFFANVDISVNRQLFDQLNLKHAPQMALLPPKLTAKVQKLKDILSRVPAKFKYQPPAIRFTPQEVTAFINKHTGLHVNVEEAMISTIELVGILICVFILAGFFWWKHEFFFSIPSFPFMKILTVAIAFFIYLYCVGGGSFNRLRGNAFSYTDQAGKSIYIANELREQMGAEAWILGGILLSLTFLTVVLSETTFEYKYVEKDGSTVNSKFASRGGAINAKAAALTGSLPPASNALAVPEFVSALMPSFANIPLLMVTWWVLLRIYSIKNYGYNHGFVWMGW